MGLEDYPEYSRQKNCMEDGKGCIITIDKLNVRVQECEKHEGQWLIFREKLRNGQQERMLMKEV